MSKPIEFVGHPYSYNAHPPTYRFAVKRCADADTYEGWVDFGLREYGWRQIRLRGFDAPELFSPRNALEKTHAEQAKVFAERLLIGKPVIVRTHRDVATYDRFEAEVLYYASGSRTWLSLADAMREAGLAKLASYEAVA